MSLATESCADPARALLEVRRLQVQYTVRRALWPGRPVVLKALDGLSFDLNENETLAIIGESGCGKSTLLRTLVGLQQPTSGEGQLSGIALFSQHRRIQRQIHQRMQMVFQDPFGSLNPRRRVGDTLGTALAQRLLEPDARRGEVESLLHQVGLRPAHAHCFPHQLSGGQRQRVAIARALAPRPALLVLDEPTSALDVSIQAQVANLLQELKSQQRLSYLLVAHDLGLIRQMADRVIVMYLGKILETGPAAAVLERPLHPYTQTLVAASRPPGYAPRRQRRDQSHAFELQNPVQPLSGCRFSSRCRHATDLCRTVEPKLVGCVNQHAVACHYSATVAHP
jgi:peptide/nickel transport system ATP-binding protein